jgi:hypothetical protein
MIEVSPACTKKDRNNTNYKESFAVPNYYEQKAD